MPTTAVAVSPHGAIHLIAIGFATLFVAVVSGLAVQGTVPATVPVFYSAMSVAAAVVYRSDKAAAERGGWRTSERTLHVIALLGGWPGALVAQGMFRHKSRKRSFRLVFWTTVVVNCGTVMFFLWMADR